MIFVCKKNYAGSKSNCVLYQPWGDSNGSMGPIVDFCGKENSNSFLGSAFKTFFWQFCQPNKREICFHFTLRAE